MRSRSEATTVAAGPADYDVQNARVEVPAPAGSGTVWLRIEHAVTFDGGFVIEGWSSSTAGFELLVDGAKAPTEISRRDRTDVAQALELGSGEDLGFTVVGRASLGDAGLVFTWQQSSDLRIPISLATFDRGGASLPDLVRLRAATRLAPFSEGWSALVDGTTGRTPHADELVGNLEVALAGPTGGVLSGWFLTGRKVDAVWVEHLAVEAITLETSVRRARQDVLDAYGAQFPATGLEPGFSVLVPQAAAGDRLRLRALVGDDIVEVSQITVRHLPEDPKGAAEMVLGMSPAAPNRVRQYIEGIAQPVLQNLVEARRDDWEAHPVAVKSLGQPIEEPKVSVVVPLYGRIDFVEHQLIEFARDPWFVSHAELVYVIDDPRLVDRSHLELGGLSAIYGVPFTLVWGGTNRGFSGANNLGAAHSRGDYLLFLNSDAFPQEPGWLASLVDRLEQRDDVAAVAPRLTFGDGAIQHSGMEFRRREDLEIWVNHHPNMGLDPKFDPAGSEDVEVQTVTGACLLTRRSDFDAVDGWDTGYLIGDFEDSDFCLKMRDRGKRIVYTPSIQLTHLERQSFTGLGAPDFRQKVVIYNALRHESRWEHVLKELTLD